MTDEYASVLKDIRSAAAAGYKRFYPDFDFGTLLYKNGAQAFLLCCANQAVSRIDGVFVKKIRLNNGFLMMDVYINDAERQVCLQLEHNS